MEKRAFNLLDEPWILAEDRRGEAVKLSLPEVFARAHELKALSGDMPAQDIAILRLLLGVLYAVYTRTDAYNEARDESDTKRILKLWKELWDAGRFEEGIIGTYLRGYEDRFWLVHPTHPFWQIAGLKNGTEGTAAKLIGNLSESNNKLRLFQGRSGRAKDALDYDEAARWLIHLNGFDDASAKPSVRKSGMPSVGPGWLGKLGIVFAMGNTLFETLLLNLVLLDHNENPWDDGVAAWETDPPRTGERTQIPLPDNQIELLTLQSRRVLLKVEDDRIKGFIALGGDFFSEENAFSEQMTLWKWAKGEKGAQNFYKPKRHNPAKQFWRDFSSIFAANEGDRLPGIIHWLSRLEYHNKIVSRHVKIQALSVQYAGAQRSAVEDAWEDSISVHAKLLSKLGDAWIVDVTKNLKITDAMVACLGDLASDIAAASGISDGRSKSAPAKEEAYFRLDMPFRGWLAGINPEKDPMDDTCKEWIDTVRDILLSFGEELIQQAGVHAFIGREVKKKGKRNLYTAPTAHAKFRGRIHKLIKTEGYS